MGKKSSVNAILTGHTRTRACARAHTHTHTHRAYRENFPGYSGGLLIFFILDVGSELGFVQTCKHKHYQSNVTYLYAYLHTNLPFRPP